MAEEESYSHRSSQSLQNLNADLQLINPTDYLPIKDNNFKVDFDTFKSQSLIISEVLKVHPINHALTYDPSTFGIPVPILYVQQYWRSLRQHYNARRDSTTLRGEVDHFTLILTLSRLRTILGLPTANSRPPFETFEDLPFETELIQGIRNLGYSREINTPSSFRRMYLHPMYYTLFSIINRCMTSKHTGLETGNVNMLRMLLGIANHRHYDYALLIWNDLLQLVNDKGYEKKDRKFLPYQRFLPMIIQYFMAENQEIPRREGYAKLTVKSMGYLQRQHVIPDMVPMPLSVELINLCDQNLVIVRDYKKSVGYHPLEQREPAPPAQGGIEPCEDIEIAAQQPEGGVDRGEPRETSERRGEAGEGDTREGEDEYYPETVTKIATEAVGDVFDSSDSSDTESTHSLQVGIEAQKMKGIFIIEKVVEKEDEIEKEATKVVEKEVDVEKEIVVESRSEKVKDKEREYVILTEPESGKPEIEPEFERHDHDIECETEPITADDIHNESEPEQQTDSQIIVVSLLEDLIDAAIDEVEDKPPYLSHKDSTINSEILELVTSDYKCADGVLTERNSFERSVTSVRTASDDAVNDSVSGTESKLQEPSESKKPAEIILQDQEMSNAEHEAIVDIIPGTSVMFVTKRETLKDQDDDLNEYQVEPLHSKSTSDSEVDHMTYAGFVDDGFEEEQEEREQEIESGSESVIKEKESAERTLAIKSLETTSTTRPSVFGSGIETYTVTPTVQAHNSVYSQQETVLIVHGEKAQNLSTPRLEGVDIETRDSQFHASEHRSSHIDISQIFDFLNKHKDTLAANTALFGGKAARTSVVDTFKGILQGLEGNPTRVNIESALNVGGIATQAAVLTGDLSDPGVAEFVSREYLNDALKAVQADFDFKLNAQTSVLRQDLEDCTNSMKALLKGKHVVDILPTRITEGSSGTKKVVEKVVEKDHSIDELKSLLYRKLLSVSSPNQEYVDLVGILRAQQEDYAKIMYTDTLNLFKDDILFGMSMLSETVNKRMDEMDSRLKVVEETCKAQAQSLKRKHDDKESDQDRREGEKRHRLYISKAIEQQVQVLSETVKKRMDEMDSRLKVVEETCKAQAQSLKRKHDDKESDQDRREGEKRLRLYISKAIEQVQVQAQQTDTEQIQT